MKIKPSMRRAMWREEERLEKEWLKGLEEEFAQMQKEVKRYEEIN